MNISDIKPNFIDLTSDAQIGIVLSVRQNRRISKRAIKQQTKSFDKDMKKVAKMKPDDIMSLLSQLMGG